MEQPKGFQQNPYNVLIVMSLIVNNLTLNDSGNYSCCIRTANNYSLCDSKDIKTIFSEQIAQILFGSYFEYINVFFF